MAKSELHMNLKYASKDVAIAEIRRVKDYGVIPKSLIDSGECGADDYSFNVGCSHGYIIALMHIFDISQKEIDL